MSKIVKVKVNKDALDMVALAGAAMDCDHEEVARQLDAALEFSGVGGAIIERVDGPIFNALGDVVCDLVSEAVKAGASK